MLDNRKTEVRMQEGEKNVENSCLMIDFLNYFFLTIEILSLLSADQFCNQKLFLHAEHRKSYISLLHVIARATRQKSLIAFLFLMQQGILFPVAE